MGMDYRNHWRDYNIDRNGYGCRRNGSALAPGKREVGLARADVRYVHRKYIAHNGTV